MVQHFASCDMAVMRTMFFTILVVSIIRQVVRQILHHLCPPILKALSCISAMPSSVP